jgi:hypothetical protein
MADKKSKSSSNKYSYKQPDERGMTVKQSSCGCTYLAGKKDEVLPGMDKRGRTSWCGKSGGSSGNCDFL